MTVTNGTYRYLCDPHPTTMRGTFTVGTVQTPPPPPPSPPAAPRRTPTLVAFVGPGTQITLTTTSGRRVRSVKAGRYQILIRDRSKIHNFHLVGPGVNKKTSVGFLGRTAWTVTFRKGRTYRYVCDPHKGSMRGSFRAR